MSTRIIRLCYRKVIDHATAGAWDQLVHEASFKEFQLQAQRFTGEKKYTRFADMIANVIGSDQLHFLTGNAINGYLRQLNGLMPDIADNLGRRNLKFTAFRFEIVNSNLNSIKDHTIAISFFSEPLNWIATIHQFLLVNIPSENVSSEDGQLTQLIELRPYLSIYSTKETG